MDAAQWSWDQQKLFEFYVPMKKNYRLYLDFENMMAFLVTQTG